MEDKDVIKKTTPDQEDSPLVGVLIVLVYTAIICGGSYFAWVWTTAPSGNQIQKQQRAAVENNCFAAHVNGSEVEIWTDDHRSKLKGLLTFNNDLKNQSTFVLTIPADEYEPRIEDRVENGMWRRWTVTYMDGDDLTSVGVTEQSELVSCDLEFRIVDFRIRMVKN